jgi:hypothetical protein
LWASTSSYWCTPSYINLYTTLQASPLHQKAQLAQLYHRIDTCVTLANTVICNMWYRKALSYHQLLWASTSLYWWTPSYINLYTTLQASPLHQKAQLAQLYHRIDTCDTLSNTAICNMWYRKALSYHKLLRASTSSYWCTPSYINLYTTLQASPLHQKAQLAQLYHRIDTCDTLANTVICNMWYRKALSYHQLLWASTSSY